VRARSRAAAERRRARPSSPRWPGRARGAPAPARRRPLRLDDAAVEELRHLLGQMKHGAGLPRWLSKLAGGMGASLFGRHLRAGKRRRRCSSSSSSSP
jgi:hypothetical protein